MTVPQGTVVTSPAGSGEQVVAVTGSASFLGSHLIGLLEDSPRTKRIVSLDLQAPRTAGPKTRHFHVDLTDHHVEDQVTELLRAEKATIFVHLAFHALPSHQADESHHLESVGTMHVVNACRRTAIRKFILSSQTLLYGASPKNPSFLTEKHPLCAATTDGFFRDKMSAERDALEFGLPGKGRVATILRTAPIVGPTVDNYTTRYLRMRLVPAVLGFDPLCQFLHEADAVAAFKRAVDHDAPGIFNLAGSGVLPLSKVVRLVGRTRLPLTRPLTEAFVGALWVARKCPIPPAFVDYIQYACIADTESARRVLGFVPLFSSRETVVDFSSSQTLREVRLISEGPA